MSDKIALVTGAASGIGAATARQLASAGIKVAACDVNAAGGAAIAKEIGGEFIPCNVTSFEDVERAVGECIERLGVPDFAHLNAGVMTVPTDAPFLAIEDVTIEQYRRIIGVNLDGVFFGLKTLLPRMREKGGAITITASIAAFGMLPIDPLYSATKHSLVGFARSVAAANEGSNMRINVICPGVVDTAIVPESFKAPQFNMITPDILAAEVVDLLQNGANGEVRVKMGDRPAFTVEPIDVNE